MPKMSALIANATPPSDTSRPFNNATTAAPGDRRARHPRLRFAFRHTLHGEAVVQTPEGTKTVVVQRGNRDLVRRFRRVEELDWGESAEIAGTRVESVEVRHWGARMVTDRHRGYGGE